MRQLEVYVNEVKAGILTELNPGKGYTFAYDAEYVVSDYPPVSLSLPKSGLQYQRTEAIGCNSEGYATHIGIWGTGEVLWRDRPEQDSYCRE